MNTIAERVAAGAAWLDAHEPGWVDRIDLGGLDIQSCDRCILGQVYGHYVDAPDDARRTGDQIVSADRGFCAGGEADGFLALAAEWAALAAAWRELILTRRAVAR
jgi:hypothetical protein